MSAWIVSAHHIDALAHALTRRSKHGLVLKYWYAGAVHECTDPDKVGRTLLAECVESVAYRYPDDEDSELPGSSARPETYYYRPPADFTAIELLGALACYEYQSCEHPAWHDSEARAICHALRARLVRELPDANTSWGIDEESRVAPSIPPGR